MKSNYTTVSIVVAAVVLVLAYGVGLVIRNARVNHAAPVPVSNEPLPKRTTQPTQAERQKLKDAREQKIEESRNLTPEQKEQRKEAIVQRLTPPDQTDANRPAARAGRPAIRGRQVAVPRSPNDVNSVRTAPPVANRPQDGKSDASIPDANSAK